MSASLAPECNDVKERYDACFIKWYSEKYLRGKTDAKDCDQIFKEYKACLAKTLKEKGIDAMVEEARVRAKETDQEYMKKQYSPVVASDERV